MKFKLLILIVVTIIIAAISVILFDRNHLCKSDESEIKGKLAFEGDKLIFLGRFNQTSELKINEPVQIYETEENGYIITLKEMAPDYALISYHFYAAPGMSYNCKFKMYKE